MYNAFISLNEKTVNLVLFKNFRQVQALKFRIDCFKCSVSYLDSYIELKSGITQLELNLSSLPNVRIYNTWIDSHSIVEIS